MRDTIFRQYDARWGSLPYPTRSYSFANNGCGCCACTHLVIEIDKYKKCTPRTLRKYMVGQGFATRGHGTTWDGITRTLRHYGFDVVTPNIASDMSAAWKELNKGNRGGVLLFRAGSRGGVTWTSGGHYVAFTAYKVKNGKHYFYTKDSGGRRHDGWHCYEDTMMGLLPKIWIVKLPKSTGKSYTGKLPTKTIKRGSKGVQVRRWQAFLKWYGYKIQVGSIAKAAFRDNTKAKTIAFQRANGLVADGIVGQKTRAKAKAVKR